MEVWASDEQRSGLKPIVRKVWAFGKERPIVPVQHRYQWRYLVGFVHPASGRTVWHLASGISTAVFSAELAAFAKAVSAGPQKQIVLVLDRAGWHVSAQLQVPEHVHLLFLPAHSPELNPAEHLWRLSDTALVNQHFAGLEELDEAQWARCAVLQRRRDLIHSTTCFSWWPRRIRLLQPTYPT